MITACFGRAIVFRCEVGGTTLQRASALSLFPAQGMAISNDGHAARGRTAWLLSASTRGEPARSRALAVFLEAAAVSRIVWVSVFLALRWAASARRRAGGSDDALAVPSGGGRHIVLHISSLISTVTVVYGQLFPAMREVALARAYYFGDIWASRATSMWAAARGKPVAGSELASALHMDRPCAWQQRSGLAPSAPFGHAGPSVKSGAVGPQFLLTTSVAVAFLMILCRPVAAPLAFLDRCGAPGIGAEGPATMCQPASRLFVA